MITQNCVQNIGKHFKQIKIIGKMTCFAASKAALDSKLIAANCPPCK